MHLNIIKMFDTGRGKEFDEFESTITVYKGMPVCK